MACFKGSIRSFISPKGNVREYESLSGDISAFDILEGDVMPYMKMSGSLSTVCPVNVAGPKSLLLDNGEELWYDEAYPFDYE